MSLIITFQSTHQVLKAEKILLAAGVKFDIIPTPKNISSECGMSIRVDAEVHSSDGIRNILLHNSIVFRFNENHDK
jgi:hypothetical protein